MTTVFLARVDDYDAEALAAAVDSSVAPFGGWSAIVPRDASVLLKPNLLIAATPESATCTHPAFVEAVLRRVIDCGGKPIIADSPSFGTAERVAEKAGIGAVARRYGVPIVDLRRHPVWIEDEKTTTQRFKIAREVLEADVLLNLPKWKVHRQMLLTGAIKNLYGCIPGKRKAAYHVSHGSDRRRFARMILEYVEQIRPTLTLVDGVVAMHRNGPRGGEPYRLRLVFGGRDPVAVDRVGCEIVGVEPDDYAFLAVAREDGFGEPDLSSIAIEGLPLRDARVDDFELPTLIPVSFSPFRLAKSIVKDFWKRRIASAAS